MYKKTITYKDYNGDEHTEDFYFNLTQADLLDMEIESNGFREMIQRIVDAENNTELFKVFKSIIRRSYGKKSPDGKRFIKSDEIFEEFESSPAYSDFVMSLVLDSTAGLDFVNGIMPIMDENVSEKVVSLN